MENLIRQSWWKFLGMFILAGALFIALSTPLSPGILAIDDVVQQGDNLAFSITGYNSHFTQGEDLQVWIQSGDFVYCSSDLQIQDDSHLGVRMKKPQPLPANLYSVLLNNTVDGTLVSIDGLFLKGEVGAAIVPPAKCYTPIAISEHDYFSIPFRTILYESIRNLNFHVPMWFSMIFLTLLSFVTAILFLIRADARFDDMTMAAIQASLLFAACGLATGAFWARFTWGAFWTNDPQLNGAALSTLIYLAYFLLRRSIADSEKRARLSAVYAIFAFVMFYIFVKVIPGMADFSLHPDTTDNPSFRDYDIEGKLKIVFRTATAGWIVMSFWIFSLRYRMLQLERKHLDR